MFWTLTGALTASWLLFMPALWPEQAVRSWSAAAIGLLALPLTILGVASPAMRRTVGWLGLILGVGNFVIGGSLGAIASYAVCGVLLVGAGASPIPQVVAQPGASELPRSQTTAVEPELPLAA